MDPETGKMMAVPGTALPSRGQNENVAPRAPDSAENRSRTLLQPPPLSLAWNHPLCPNQFPFPASAQAAPSSWAAPLASTRRCTARIERMHASTFSCSRWYRQYAAIDIYLPSPRMHLLFACEHEHRATG
eukprot:4541428-Pleurochrysis_carterae.AAC.1